MILPQLVSEMLKQLSNEDIKIAAESYGLSKYYFTQKIKSVDTNSNDLVRAVECLMKTNQNRNDVIKELYEQFLSQVEEQKNKNNMQI